jgi:hypothetical protein
MSPAMINAGRENGYVKNALLMWKSSSSHGDCHSQMIFKNYEKWLFERLIPNLQPRSVVPDNAPYHSVRSYHGSGR